MQENSLGGRLVVVGSHREDGIRTFMLSADHQLVRVQGVVGSRSGHHRNRSRGRLHAGLDDHCVFLLAERDALARGPAGHQEVDSRFDLPLHQPAERVQIHVTLRCEGGDQGSSTAFEFNHPALRKRHPRTRGSPACPGSTGRRRGRPGRNRRGCAPGAPG